MTGDFFQLPPVNKGSQSVKFAFEAEHWKRALRKTFNLTKVFRQRDPGPYCIFCHNLESPKTFVIAEFVDMLNEMRFGRLTQKSISKFRSLQRPIESDDGVSATELYVAVSLGIYSIPQTTYVCGLDFPGGRTSSARTALG